MKLMTLLVAVLFLAVPVSADIMVDGETEDDFTLLDLPGGIRAGQLEVTPLLSMSFSGDDLIYRAGASVGYALTRSHQIGGSFVMGNRVNDRVNNNSGGVVTTPSVGSSSPGFSFDEGFGGSLTGFYRFNVPFEIQEKTYPFVEAFGGRDFGGWGNVSEAGGGAGVRKMLSNRTALTSQYAYSVLFYQGDTFPRHLVSVGVSMIFR
jgi:hypothetical protein